MNSKGISSLSILIIVVLVVFIGWQTAKYVEEYMGLNKEEETSQKAGYDPNCTGDDCDIDEGAGTLPPRYTPPAENEVFSWVDDGKP